MHRAFGEAGNFRKRPQTSRYRLPLVAGGLAVKPQVDKVGGRLTIVTDDIAHENIEDIIVNRNDLLESRHVGGRTRFIPAFQQAEPGSGNDGARSSLTFHCNANRTSLFLIGRDYADNSELKSEPVMVNSSRVEPRWGGYPFFLVGFGLRVAT